MKNLTKNNLRYVNEKVILKPWSLNLLGVNSFKIGLTSFRDMTIIQYNSNATCSLSAYLIVLNMVKLHTLKVNGKAVL